MLICLQEIYEGFIFEDKSTWKLLRKVSQCKHAMLFQHQSVGWAQFAVDLRQAPRMADLFAAIWTIHTGKRVDPLDLLCAPDGFSCYVNTPSEKGGFHRIGHDSLHSDQAADDPAFSVQSFVNLVDTIKDGAAFQFLEGSHKKHKAFFDAIDQYKEDLFGDDAPVGEYKRFTLLENQVRLNFYLKSRNGKAGCPEKCIAALAGDVVLWNSKTIHSARQAIRPPPPFDPEAVCLRGAVYVCMQPRYLATSADLKKKIKAYIDLRTTTHNAASGITFFEKIPRTYGKTSEYIVRRIRQTPWLSKLGYSLFGLDKRIAGYPYDPETHKMMVIPAPPKK
jgi:hypothetical protein